MMATDNNAAPGVAWIGEHGPEKVLFLRGGETVIPNSVGGKTVIPHSDGEALNDGD